MIFNKSPLWLGVVIALSAVLCACQTMRFTYTGSMVSKERRIAVSGGGPHSRTWQAEDLELEYAYTRAPQTFHIAGTVHFRREKVIWTFRMDVHFADATGAILSSRNLVTSGSKQMIDSLSFEAHLDFPPNAEYMSFSYSGTASGTGNSGSPSDFWITP